MLGPCPVLGFRSLKPHALLPVCRELEAAAAAKDAHIASLELRLQEQQDAAAEAAAEAEAAAAAALSEAKERVQASGAGCALLHWACMHTQDCASAAAASASNAAALHGPHLFALPPLCRSRPWPPPWRRRTRSCTPPRTG